MLDLGWQELFFITLVAIIVVGPKDLPMLVRSISRWIFKARRLAQDFQGSLEIVAREAEIESFISGLGLAKRFNKLYGKNLKTNEIFELNRKHDLDAERFIDDFKVNLAMSLSSIINILDPDAFVFGGGVSNEIDFLHEIDALVRKFVIGREYEGVFLKPRYGDASGVRGAARLGRSATY